METIQFYWAELSDFIVRGGFPLAALSGVTLCVPPQLPCPDSQPHTNVIINTSRSSGILTYAGCGWYVARHSSQLTTWVWCSHEGSTTAVTHVTNAHLLRWFILLFAFNPEHFSQLARKLRTWLPPRWMLPNIRIFPVFIRKKWI